MTKTNITGIIAEAKRFERERIIKLLEASESACAEWAIALIKGETV